MQPSLQLSLPLSFGSAIELRSSCTELQQRKEAKKASEEQIVPEPKILLVQTD